MLHFLTLRQSGQIYQTWVLLSNVSEIELNSIGAHLLDPENASVSCSNLDSLLRNIVNAECNSLEEVAQNFCYELRSLDYSEIIEQLWDDHATFLDPAEWIQRFFEKSVLTFRIAKAKSAPLEDSERRDFLRTEIRARIAEVTALHRMRHNSLRRQLCVVKLFQYDDWCWTLFYAIPVQIENDVNYFNQVALTWRHLDLSKDRRFDQNTYPRLYLESLDCLLKQHLANKFISPSLGSTWVDYRAELADFDLEALQKNLDFEHFVTLADFKFYSAGGHQTDNSVSSQYPILFNLSKISSEIETAELAFDILEKDLKATILH
jgi:hypothetical protein